MSSKSIKLFCIPFSGGNAYSYSVFKKHLSSSIEFHNLELPGRGLRMSEPLLYSVDEMTDDLFRLIEHQLDGSYAIFGHSLGALLAYTLCRKIVSKGARLPSVLFLSGQKAPSLMVPDERFLLPDEQFVDVLREMKGTPEELLSEKSFLNFFLPIARADFEAIETYKYNSNGDPISIPMVVFIGKQENISDREVELWQKETDRDLSVYRFDGAHFFIFNCAEEVCRLINERCLAQTTKNAFGYSVNQ